MGEAIPHKICMEGPAKCVFPDDLLEGEQHSRRLAVSDVAVRVIVHEKVSGTNQRILIGSRAIPVTLLGIIALMHAPDVECGSLSAENVVEDLAFGVAINSLVKPGVLEFVAGHHAIPVLVSKLVLGHQFNEANATRHPPGGVSGE